MATIQTSIGITDGATAPLQRMARAAEVTTGRFEAAATAANKIETSVAKSTSQKVGAIADAAASTVPAFGAASLAAEATAGSVGMIGAASAAARVGIVSLGVTMAAVLGSIMAAFAMIAAVLRSVLGSIHLSDEFSQTKARLDLMNDGLQTTTQLQAMIFASAQRSRSEYQATADFVAKIGMMAGKIFSSNAELIGVAETINKIFKISGTGAQEQASATLQLSQALASGVLRGEELNAVFEAAPMMIRKIADYLGVDIGMIREMAQDGLLTADIVKNAMIAATGEVNKTFESIPKTWSDIWTSFKNTALMGLQPLFNQISILANSQGLQKLFNGVAIGVGYAGTLIAGLLNNLMWLSDVGSYVGSRMVGGFTMLQPVFEWLIAFAIAFFTMYAAGWVTAQMPLLAHISALAVKAAWDAILIAYAWAQTAAMIALNSQLLLTYLRLGIVYAAMAIWTLITQGMTAAMRMLNLTMLMNPTGIVVGLVFLAIAAFGAWAIQTMGLRNSIASAFSSIAETAGNAINFMIRRVNDLIGILNKAATLINNVFGTSIGTAKMVGEVDAKSWGKSAGDFVKNFSFSNLGAMLGIAEMPNVPPIANDIATAGTATADNTKKIKEAMEITDEDIKYMRDIAEQEVINRYTTAEVKIEMGGIHNSVGSDMDLDGMVRYINDSLFEAMVSGAEKVHP